MSEERRLRINEISRRSYRKNIEKYRTRGRGAEGRARNLKRAYGITLEEFQAMSAKQSHVCAICRRPEKMRRLGTLRPLCVDHNHTTGTIRGLLCANCNTGIGKFEESKDCLVNAIHYLEEHS